MSRYERLHRISEDESDGKHDGYHASYRNPHTSIRTCLWTWSWLIHILFLAAYTALSFVHRDGSPGYFWGLEGIYNDAPVEFETVTFKRAGFHGPISPTLTGFEGRPNPQNDAEWDRVMSVGVVGISEQEANRLPSSTVESLGNPGRYVVQLEMFHQLHCLKQLRRQLWDFEDGRVDPDEASQRQQHFDHCIDYLRQAVMCHGDLTPVTFEWSEERSTYLAHHGTVHQCRKFDKIFDWAGARNTVGLATDGEHKNYDGLAKNDPAED